MEMMHHEAGVRTVAVGGQPTNGPMQAPSGSRGAAYYTSDDIDSVIDFVEQINSTTINFIPSRTDNDLYILSLGLNLRDQIRKGEYVPLQFVYEAVNCRIYFTPQTIYNYTNLWNYAASAIWTKPELCVQGSTGYATSSATDTKGPPGGSATINKNVSYDISGVIRTSGDADGFNAEVSGGIIDGSVQRPSSGGGGSPTIKYNSNVSQRFQIKKAVFNGVCNPGSPRCGGTGTNVHNPQNSLAPLPVRAAGGESRNNLLEGGSMGVLIKAGVAPWA